MSISFDVSIATQSMELTDRTFGRGNAPIPNPNALQVAANLEYLDINSDCYSLLEQKQPISGYFMKY